MRKTLAMLSLLLGAHIAAGQEASLPPALRLSLSSPLDYQVVQRSTLAAGKLVVTGTIISASQNSPLPNSPLPDRVEARVTGTPVMGDILPGDLPGRWQPLADDARGAAFHGELTVPAGGWYRLEVRAFWHDTLVASATVEHVGVGEVFVVAGQSNSANYGEEKHVTQTGLVAAFDGTTWHLARDPMPGAGGTKGSFMPVFGDELAAQFHVPIGIVATGIGSTSVREWLPAGTRLTRLPPLTRNVITNSAGQWEVSGKIFKKFTGRMKQLGPAGFRAVLWHQGESDGHQANPTRTLPGPEYQTDLEQLIRASRQAIGWDAPWFVAQASYHKADDPSSPDIRAAQKAVCDEGLAVLGPDTDTLTGEMREKHGTGIHLSAQGLKAHAHLWFEKVSPWLQQQLAEEKK